MDYKILVSTAEYENKAVEGLERDVAFHISAGWKPIGGVSSITRKDNPSKMLLIVLTQAMIKK